MTPKIIVNTRIFLNTFDLIESDLFWKKLITNSVLIQMYDFIVIDDYSREAIKWEPELRQK